jgi:hypothetical protein
MCAAYHCVVLTVLLWRGVVSYAHCRSRAKGEINGKR